MKVAIVFAVLLVAANGMTFERLRRALDGPEAGEAEPAAAEPAAAAPAAAAPAAKAPETTEAHNAAVGKNAMPEPAKSGVSWQDKADSVNRAKANDAAGAAHGHSVEAIAAKNPISQMYHAAKANSAANKSLKANAKIQNPTQGDALTKAAAKNTKISAGVSAVSAATAHGKLLPNVAKKAIAKSAKAKLEKNLKGHTSPIKVESKAKDEKGAPKGQGNAHAKAGAFEKKGRQRA